MKQFSRPYVVDHITNRRSLGLSLIEVLIDAALLSFVSVVIISTLISGARAVKNATMVSTSNQLLNEKMEMLRNLPYNSLATQRGPIYPPGDLLDTAEITKNGQHIKLKTDIYYVDDPYDGLAPNDLNPADYKKITVTALDSSSGKILGSLTSNVSSKAAETDSNTGVIKVNVLDSSGLAVSNTDVSVTNSSVSPPVSIIAHANSEGIIAIPNLPPAPGYHVTASKGGYSSDSTCEITLANPHPVNPDPSVLLQQVTPVTLSIDRTSTLKLHASGLAGNSINLQIMGQKLIGNNPDVIKTSFAQTVGDETEIDNLEYDSYSFVPPNGWYITTCDPLLPVALPADSSTEITCSFTSDPLALRVNSITPQIQPRDSLVHWQITGANFDASDQVFIQLDNNPEIQINDMAFDIDSSNLVGDVNFNNIDSGLYKVIIRSGNGQEVVQEKGLNMQ